MKRVAGIDVGKNRLDVCRSGDSVQVFENTRLGVTQVLEWIRVQEIGQVVLEASGGYERTLLDVLLESDVETVRVQPSRVRAFAHAVGLHAKTDALDARLLCRYGESLELSVSQAISRSVSCLRDHLDRRRQLVEQRVGEKNRLEKNPPDWMSASCRRHIVWLDREIARLDQLIRKMLKQGDLSGRAELLRSVKGVGEVTAGVLLAYLPELGSGCGKSLSALAGVAPWSRDSGQHQGKRSIRGGRQAVRRALYMSALSAVRHDPDLRRFYRGLRDRGKPGKVALVAVMRKMLLLLHAIVRRGTPWVETPNPIQ